LFNALTGSNFKTSNYPGATVEYSAGNLIKEADFEAHVIDTPGIVSLNASSPDEEVTISGLFNHYKYGIPDLVISTADATQLSRQLFLIKQIIDTGLKMIVALTMNDLLEKKGIVVDTEKLSELLGCPVMKVESRKRTGIRELAKTAKKVFSESLLTNYKSNINRPAAPSEEYVAELYKFTEETEQAVLKPKSTDIDINALNEKIFKNIHRKPDENSMKLDKIFLHPVWGMLIFFVAMGLIFTSIFWLARPVMNLIDSGFSNLSDLVSGILPANTWYNDLLTKGIIKGFGSVMTFLPQIVILFMYLGILEDTGYLARAAMLIDKPLTKFGQERSLTAGKGF
jgi:ferrous iron transport protein B